MKRVVFVAILLALLSCQNHEINHSIDLKPIKDIVTHCKSGGEPNLFVSQSGQIYLSWIEYIHDSEVSLMFSKFENESWSSPQIVATGDDWFVNWADFPSLVSYKNSDESLAAHWLQKSEEGTYDYDVHISQSQDGGHTWSPSFILHKDGIAAEHGFVSMYPISENRVFATWLDGRNTKGDQEAADHDDHGHYGAMSLRAAEFDRDELLFNEAELDNRVCDCCQTSAALTDQGMVVVYRDRSEDEVRDISIVRQVEGKWLESKAVYNDNWKINGCPVNGPSVVASDNVVVVGWFSMSDDKPEVKVAFSDDSGSNFYPPIKIDEGDPLGRIDLIMLPDDEVLIVWVEQVGENAAIKGRIVNNKGLSNDSFIISETKSSRQSGFPVVSMNNDQIIFAWTQVDSVTSIKTGLMKL